MKNAKKTGKINHEVRLMLKESIRYLRVAGRMLFDKKKGKLACSRLLDITQDNILLQKIKQSEERFKRIEDTTPMTIWITDKNAQCTFINKTWLDFINSKLKNNLGDNWLTFLHVEDKERGMEVYMEAFKK